MTRLQIVITITALVIFYLWGFLDACGENSKVSEKTVVEVQISCPTVNPCVRRTPATGVLSGNL